MQTRANIKAKRRRLMKVSELIKLLKKNKCKFVEHGKEHDKWFCGKTGKSIMIPRHGSKEIPTGTVY